MAQPFSPSGNHLGKFVNLWQTKEERREKYYLLRSIGLPICKCRQARDWHLTQIEKIYATELGLKKEV